MDAVEQRWRIGTKEISPVELLESTLKRIEDVNGRVNAIVAMDVDNARAEAKFAEQAVMDGEDLGLLHGLPVGIKDLEATGGLRKTLRMMLYENNVPETDDLSVENVREEGAIISPVNLQSKTSWRLPRKQVSNKIHVRFGARQCVHLNASLRPRRIMKIPSA